MKTEVSVLLNFAPKLCLHSTFHLNIDYRLFLYALSLVMYWTLFPQIEDEIRHCQEEIVKKDRLLSKLSRQVALCFSLWLLSAATSDVKLMIHIVMI